MTLFDLATLEDSADYARPIAAARGIELVMVNGVIGYRAGAATGERGGRLLRRSQHLSPQPTNPFTTEENS